MAKSKLELRLFEFSPAIEKLMAELEANTDEDGVWIGGGRLFEDIVQDVMNMEKDKKEKVLGIGHLIKHLKECMERHEAHAAHHARRAKSFENNIERLKTYIKGNIGAEEKFKDDFVSIYPMKTSAVIPTVTMDQLPVTYRRPTLVSGSDRLVVERLHLACAKQGLPSPFGWEVDKETLKKDVKANLDAGTNHPYGVLEHGRTVVVR